MKYLLVNHIAAAPGRDAAHLRLPARWARELAAAGVAARGANVRLTVATPLDRRAIDRAAEHVPDALGFEHAALPGYRSARTYLRNRDALDAALAATIAGADVVQLDHGGYPIPLGSVAWPHARAAGRRTVWVVSGAALPSSRLARQAGTIAKRVVGRHVDARIGHGLFEAIRDAAHVVATDPALVRSLRDEHKIDAHAIDVADVRDEELPDARAVAARHDRLLDTERPLRLIVRGPHVLTRGTAHVLAALHRCRRLLAGVELTIAGDGEERSALVQQAGEMGLGPIVRFADDDRAAIDDADVLVDAALEDAARQPLDAAMALGLAPIAYEPCRADAPVRCVPRGDVNWLADAILDAATRRPALAQRMLAGVAWARERTLESSYRRRFALAASSATRAA